MVSHYFLANKADIISKLRHLPLTTKLNGDKRMVRAYNQHGRESGTVAQKTCDMEMEAEFLQLIRFANIKMLPGATDLFALLPDNPNSREERKRLEHDNLISTRSQWRQCAEAAKNASTIQHYTGLIPQIQAMIDLLETEEEGR